MCAKKQGSLEELAVLGADIGKDVFTWSVSIDPAKLLCAKRPNASLGGHLRRVRAMRSRNGSLPQRAFRQSGFARDWV